MHNYEKTKYPYQDNTQIVYTRDVCCSNDHPIVYYSISVEEGRATCGYCNQTFVYVEAEV